MSTHLTRADVDRWVDMSPRGTHYVTLDAGETMPCGAEHHGDKPCLEGPGAVELVVMRNGGWNARPLRTLTVGGIRRGAQ